MKISRNARRSLALGYLPVVVAFFVALVLTDISVWSLLLLAWLGAAVLTVVIALARQEVARRPPGKGSSDVPDTGMRRGPETDEGDRRSASGEGR